MAPLPPVPVLSEMQNKTVMNVTISKADQEAVKRHLSKASKDPTPEPSKKTPKRRDSKAKGENKAKKGADENIKDVQKDVPKKEEESKPLIKISQDDLAAAGGSGMSAPGPSGSGGIKSFFKSATKEQVMESARKENEKAKKEREEKEEKQAKEKEEKEREAKEKEEKAVKMEAEQEIIQLDPYNEDDSEEEFKPDGDSKKNNKGNKKRVSIDKAASAPKKPKVAKEVCPDCYQDLESPNLKFYTGHPDGAVEEMFAFTHEAFQDICTVLDGDDRPQYRLTDYVIFDEAGHIVRFDEGIIEANGNLYVTGYMKAVFDDSSSCEGGVYACKIGPIAEWWVAGLDGSEKHVLGLTTDMAYYFLTTPREEYTQIAREIDSKVYIGKCVIDLLNEVSVDTEMEYEDLLHHLEGRLPPDGIEAINEDAVVKNADAIVSMVCSYENAADDDEELFMMDSPAIRNLMQLAGLNKRRAKNMRTIKRGPNERSTAQAKGTQMKKALFTKATTTPLVRLVMESFFRDQMAEVSEDGDDAKTKKKAKGKKDAENTEDEENLSADEDMPKPKKGSEDEDKPVEVLSSKMRKKMQQLKRNGRPSMHWDGDAIAEKAERSFYGAVIVDDDRYEPGDFAFVYVDDSNNRVYLRRVEYLYENDDGEFMAHVQWFEKGCYTILGDVAEEKEVFQMGYCDDALVANFVDKAKVTWWPTAKNWFDIGGTEEAALLPPPIDLEDESEFYYRMKYDEETARFEHGFKVSKKDKQNCAVDNCGACKFRLAKVKKTSVQAVELLENDCDEKGRFQWGVLEAYGDVLKVNDAVFYLPPHHQGTGGAGQGRNKVDEKKQEKIIRAKDSVDQLKYPEFYRKSTYVRGSNQNTAKPFSLGIIENIYSADKEGKKKLKLSLRKLYRPEECMEERQALSKDFNLVFWSEDTYSVDACHIRGKCIVRPENHFEANHTAASWTKQGQNRFYYNMVYSKFDKSFNDLTAKAERYGGGPSKGGGKGKSSGKSSNKDENRAQDDGALPDITRPKLRTLDVFAGCGGLSCGLHESGAVESKWAIEVFEPAAVAYKANNPDCTVFTDCCNLLLKKVMNGEATNDKMQVLPKKGEVDLLCGGPPCQGFSGMNRFNHREYSAFKNSLIASYLSYAEYYRPKYFILENVRNFVSFKKGTVLKLCIKALLKMGYACTFGVLQAGNYGVAQTRRRAILLAAAPGEKLPFYPEPTNVFAKTPLSVNINNRIYTSNVRWTDSAPYRTVTVRDVMSDLPEIKSGEYKDAISYVDDPITPFQRKMRERTEELTQHVCKKMSALVDARMELIPTDDPGADWRDLPNIVYKLSDGTYTDKLVYTHHDYREGRGKNKALRGVCSCAQRKGAECDPNDKQGNTLIPWCLPHTSARHNQWAGLYGRLEYDGYFSTTVTNPEPMGKQGRVLHPYQHRLVSVRECARSQGFPDWYRFRGTILEKHRQVGNAVPPPMGLALGVEIRKAMMAAVKEQEKEPEDK